MVTSNEYYRITGIYIIVISILLRVGILVEKPERKRPLGKSRRSWEDNVKLNIQEVG